MKKAIYIGELSLYVALRPDGSAATGVGDWAVNAAMLDGHSGQPTIWMGEAAAGTVGDNIVGQLESCNVDVSSVDRFTEGVSPVRIFSDGDSAEKVDYSSFPSEPVNAVWPRIDDGDVVVYGSYMALEERNHQRLLEFLRYARARKALLVYLPYFEKHQVPRITRVMPAVFDCLELADAIVARDGDIRAVFGSKDADIIFRDHILFYCRRFLHLNPETRMMRFFTGDESRSLQSADTGITEFQWCAGVLAGAVRALAEGKRDPDEVMACGSETAANMASSVISHPCTR